MIFILCRRLLEKQAKIEAIALQMTSALDPSAVDHAVKILFMDGA